METPASDEARLFINQYFLNDRGLTVLLEQLESGCYDVAVPEEGALLVVAWLAQHGDIEGAREVLEILAPYFSMLRFYPVPAQRPQPSRGSRVHLRSVGETIASLAAIKPNPQILAQKEAIQVWAPLYDKMVALFLETVEGDPPCLRRDAEGRSIRPDRGGRFPVAGGWPCRVYPNDWATRAKAVLYDVDRARKEHTLCGRPERRKDPAFQLREYLRICVTDPQTLTVRDVGKIRLILAGYIDKRGTPDSAQCRNSRDKHKNQISGPTHQEIAAAVAFVKRMLEETHGWYYDFNAIAELLTTKEALKASPEMQLAIVLEVINQLAAIDEKIRVSQDASRRDATNLHRRFDDMRATLLLICRLLRGPLPLEQEHIVRMFDCTARRERRVSTYELPYMAPLLTLTEKFVAAHGVSNDIRSALERLDDALSSIGNAPERKLRQRIAAMLADVVEIPLQPGEAWSDGALAWLAGLDGAARAKWVALLAHCQGASDGAASGKWTKQAGALVEAVGQEAFRQAMIAWLPLVDKSRTAVPPEWAHRGEQLEHILIGPHADILKGLAWCCGGFEDRELARTVTGLALSAYRKVPGIGPRAVKVGNACVYALGQMPGLDAVGQLALLKVKVRFRTATKEIDKALERAAERAGVSREDLEEMGVPAYGLTEVGRLTEPMGEVAAQLTVTDSNTTQLLWLKSDGKTQKTLPAAVKANFAEEFKELQAAAKDIQKMLPAQRERLDGLYLHRKTWPLETWRQRYLDHPLVGTLARRLIWCFDTGNSGHGGHVGGGSREGIFFDGQLRDVHDRPLDLPAEATVSLWHPIGRAVDDVLDWREWLERHEVRQPFKQAHREVYLLTDAERNTHTYSNRYAAHIVRQHQFNALCGVRGWKNVLKLLVDQEFPPASRALAAWGLRAEFWTDGAGDDYGTDTNDTGTFHRLATDQVRFFALDAPTTTGHAYGRGQTQTADPLPLEQIPPLVFSEIMRDVDLFVGVASVGNDPTWSDGGPDGRYRDYWQSYSFGQLSGTAETRRDVLAKLMPRLKIAQRCSLAERFLVVRGDLRTYKIHLGSGNILMEPNDQYLCIVPGRSADAGEKRGGEKLFLPFEGDHTMAIILSKAFLLAQDTKITDPTITKQIRGK